MRFSRAFMILRKDGRMGFYFIGAAKRQVAVVRVPFPSDGTEFDSTDRNPRREPSRA